MSSFLLFQRGNTGAAAADGIRPIVTIVSTDVEQGMKLDEVREQIRETKRIMEQSIDGLLQRNEKLDSLEAKTEILRAESVVFK